MRVDLTAGAVDKVMLQHSTSFDISGGNALTATASGTTSYYFSLKDLYDGFKAANAGSNDAWNLVLICKDSAVVTNIDIVTLAANTVPADVELGGKTYTETLTYGVDIADGGVAIGNWTPLSTGSTGLGSLIAAGSAENSYVKVVSDETTYGVVLQGSDGTGSGVIYTHSTVSFNTTDDGKAVNYYNFADLMAGYSSAGGTNDYWNMLMSGNGRTIYSLDVVTLTEKTTGGEPTTPTEVTLDDKTYTEESVYASFTEYYTNSYAKTTITYPLLVASSEDYYAHLSIANDNANSDLTPTVLKDYLTGEGYYVKIEASDVTSMPAMRLYTEEKIEGSRAQTGDSVGVDSADGSAYYYSLADLYEELGYADKGFRLTMRVDEDLATINNISIVKLTEKTSGEPTPEGLTVKSYNTGTAYTATEALISQVTRAEFWSDINEEKHEFDIAYPWNPGNEDLSTLTTSDVKYLPRYLLADNLPTTLNADDVYIKVTTSVSTIGKVTLEGAAGMAKEISAAKYVTTVGGNTVMYFSGKALIQGGLNSIDGGAMEQIWNIGILPSNDNVKIENIEIVTLDVDTPVGEVKTLGGKKYTESDLVTLNIGSGIVLTNKWQWTAFNSGNTATPPQTWLEAMNEENTYIKFTVSAGVVDQLIMQSNKGDNDQSETKFTDADIAFIATEDGKTVNYFDANKVIKAMYANGCSDGEYWYQFAVCPANPMTIYSVEVVTLEPAVKVDVKVGDIEVGEAWEDAEITAANATVDYTAPEGTATEEDAENGKDVEVTVTVEGVLAPEELDVTVDGKKLTLTAEDLDYESSEGNTVFKVTVNIGVITADNRTTGWICTGDKYHAMMIGRAIITLPHEFGTDGDCIYCHYNKDTDTLTVSNSYESTEEETEDVEAPAEENPETGLTLALVPAVVALAAVAFKKR